MSEIPKTYEPAAVEAKWYRYWLDRRCFVADPASTKPAYSIVIPPPNVTGVLHMGHVLNNTIQDLLARKARMDGREVLWLPGTDHAGIATQAVVEKALRKEGKMKHRDELGRDQFLAHVWAWKEKHGGIIIQQLQKLGCSCDWTRARFTLDPAYSRCVLRVFVELYRKGLLYRGRRMVNWDPAARTAISDEEVEMREEKGHLWHLKYPLLDDRGQPQADAFVVVATTRPETMLGDEAVAVHPTDPRYQKLVGRRVLLPLQDRPIPVIADAAVDPRFGTGCVKVTPAHDPADYDIALRHGLPLTVVIGPDGCMTHAAGEDFDGLDRMEARQAVVEELTEQGLLLKTEEYVHHVGYSQRSHVPIEPYLSEQWFLKYPSVAAAIACVAGRESAEERVPRLPPPTKEAQELAELAPPSGARLRFHPDRWTKTYTHWMHHLRDWCISRQLWWGHRVPVWHKRVRLEARNWTDELLPWGWDDYVEQRWADQAEPVVVRIFRCADGQAIEPARGALMPVVRETEGDYDIFVCTADPERGRSFERFGFLQDPDVLDTWFSSWLWPFATMGWPEATDTLKKFYPTTDLVTGPDIIFFWVARMIMAGYEFMSDPKFGLADALPFRNVYFTGIIRDKLGRKMSKTLGNSPDPLDLIARYGADALRFGTMRSAPLGQDVLFDEKDVELGRNFCNKLWNACRFRQMQGAEAAGAEVQAALDPARLTRDDKWLLLRLDAAIREVTQALAAYRFNEVTQTLYRVFWSEYCDWYVEASKAVFQGNDAAAKAHTLAVIDFVLSHLLRLFHPFLPFITEELWHDLGYGEDMPEAQGRQTIMFAPWPKPLDAAFAEHYGLTASDEQFVNAKYELVTQGRNLRREHHLPAQKRLRFVLRPAAPLAPHDVAVLRALLNAESVEVNPGFEPARGTPVVHSSLGDLYLPLAGLVDAAAERARLQKELAKIQAELGKVQAKLENPAFLQKVPAPVLEEHRRRLTQWQAKEAQVRSALGNLG